MNNHRIISGMEMMNTIAELTPLGGQTNELVSTWKKVVSNIGKKNENEIGGDEITLGERMAANSHVVDLKNGVLLIEANHSGWIQYLRMYQNFILKGLNWAVPNLKIKNLAFRVAGSEANLSVQYEDLVKKEKQEMSKKIEQEQNMLNEKFEKKDENKNEGSLPPELLSRFENLKKQMENEQ